MWKWGVPSGVPIMLCAAIGGWIGYDIVDDKSVKEHRDWETVSEVMKGAARGMLVGAGIGLIVLGVPALVCWLLLSVPGRLCLMGALVGTSIGGILGFLSAASTSYRRP